jgi:predicted aspartyl protease
MFQIVLSLIIGVFIGWNFHLFYVSLEPKNLMPKSLMLSESYTAKPISEAISPKLISKNRVDKNISTITPKVLNIKLIEKRIIVKNDKERKNYIRNKYFQVLLKQNNFSDAMAFYMEGTPEEIKAYQLILKVYFYDKALISPDETIEQLLQYIEIEPQNLDIQLYLAKIYRDEHEFQKSIEFLFELQHSYQDKDLKRITNELDTTIESYITKLTEAKSVSKLILFLEDIISKSNMAEKYMIRLAELYRNLEIYDKAEEILNEVNIDSTYNNQAINLIKELHELQIETEEYPHKIALNKIGSQFSVNLTINNTPLTLLLDTGASYTFIDVNKIPNLEEGKEILLNTAGGEITGELYLAQSLIIQDIELTDFEITVAPFRNQNMEGLLGMNFFEKFNFKIDQEKAMLYLGNH